MSKVSLLKERLQQIANTLEEDPHGLALMGLGSSGAEIARMDKWSDLDFFAIVEEGFKQQFIDDLCWLNRVHPIAWCFKNTKDGYKLLFQDGVFCEFAVFEPRELNSIPYIAAQFIWRDISISENLIISSNPPAEQSSDQSFLLGELLTNLYVGLCRYHRGEKLSAMRFIQIYALDRLVTLLDLSSDHEPAFFKDGFCPDRRVELRHSNEAKLLQNCAQGTTKCIESAQVMMDFVESQYLTGDLQYQSIIKEIRDLLSYPRK